MWFLNSVSDQRIIYLVGQKKEITISRNADTQANTFVIPEDPSISRKHAILSNQNDELFIQDLGSRYGTFINDSNEKIESNVMVKLNNEDTVRFGKMNSVWRVHMKSFVTCTSTLKGENVQNLKQCLKNLSGTLKNEWDDTCTFLTMPAITLTMKVVLALVQGAQIVTVDFWNKCLQAVTDKTMLPDPNEFTPEIVESTLNKECVSFRPDSCRKTLFNGKRFVFFSKRQFDMYKSVIMKASATPLLLSDSKMTKSMLCEEGVVVVQHNINAASQENQAQRNAIQDITKYLKEKGKRLVTDAEIGLAILYCSCDKYCNPDFNFPSEVIKNTNPSVRTANILAQESQEPTQLIQCKKENVIIDESLSSSIIAESASSKRKLPDDDIQDNSYKKLALGGINSGLKRKLDDVNNDTNSNLSKKIATSYESSDSQDCFKFVNNFNSNSDNQNESSAKRLNLNKPQKRKLECDDNDDDMFQFVQDKSKIPATSKSNIFSNVHKEDTDDINNTDKVTSYNNNVDISSLRGAKLAELMANNEKILSNAMDDHKDQIKEELDEKMSHLDLCGTIVIVNKDLIVKKEPIQIETQSVPVKNFKTFKKVWPVKMQVTVISKSSNDSHIAATNGGNSMLESV